MEQTALQTVSINNHNLFPKEVNGQRVVTFKDVDELHERPEGTAKRNFNENKVYFIEGEDFYKICADEIRTNKIMGISPKAHQDVVFLTEFGYLMLVKSLTDKLAWQVQRQLVNNYFRNKAKNSIPHAQPNYNEIQLTVQKQISDQYRELASDISFIKHEIFKMVYAPSNSEWKRSVNAKILEVNKVTKISCTSLLNNIYIQMRENGCNLIELAHRYEFENGLTQCPIIEYIDKHEDQKRQFEILLDELVSRTFPIKALNHSNVEVSQKYLNVQQEKEKSEVLEAPIEKPIATDIVKTTIQPLIEKYMDSSKGGHATYRKVYTAMGVCWVNRQTRYKNEYHLKNAPKKSTLIKKDEKLMKLFVDTVNNLMAN